MLVKEGCCVHEASNGKEGLKALSQFMPDLVLLDLMMPEMDGFEMLQAMREREDWKSVPVIVVTAKDLRKEELETIKSQADQVILKGALRRQNLVGAIQEMIAERLGADGSPPSTASVSVWREGQASG
jgi:CheY-like chemotaxis protein